MKQRRELRVHGKSSRWPLNYMSICSPLYTRIFKQRTATSRAACSLNFLTTASRIFQTIWYVQDQQARSFVMTVFLYKCYQMWAFLVCLKLCKSWRYPRWSMSVYSKHIEIKYFGFYKFTIQVNWNLFPKYWRSPFAGLTSLFTFQPTYQSLLKSFTWPLSQCAAYWQYFHDPTIGSTPVSEQLCCFQAWNKSLYENSPFVLDLQSEAQILLFKCRDSLVLHKLIKILTILLGPRNVTIFFE